MIAHYHMIAQQGQQLPLPLTSTEKGAEEPSPDFPLFPLRSEAPSSSSPADITEIVARSGPEDDTRAAPGGAISSAI